MLDKSDHCWPSSLMSHAAGSGATRENINRLLAGKESKLGSKK
jgi:hypothetical protein